MRQIYWKLFLCASVLVILLHPILKGRAQDGLQRGAGSKVHDVRKILADWEDLHAAALGFFSVRLKMLADYRPSQRTPSFQWSVYPSEFNQGLKEFRSAINRLLVARPPPEIKSFHWRFLPIYRRIRRTKAMGASSTRRCSKRHPRSARTSPHF